MKDKKIKIAPALLAIVILASLPLFLPGIEGRTGQDLQYHLNRIEGIAEAIKAGQIGSRMQAYWLNGYGYPTSIYYGDLLLYIPAFLRLLGLPVVAAYKAFVVLINAATAAISYVCFAAMLGQKFGQRLGANSSVKSGANSGQKSDANSVETSDCSCCSYIALACTAAYTLSAYRFLDLYVRAAVGEYCAIMFMPIIALGMVRLYSPHGGTLGCISLETSASRETPTLVHRAGKDTPSPNENYSAKNEVRRCEGHESCGIVLTLAIGMTGLIGTHLISTEMAVITIGIIALVLWRQTFKKQTFFAWLKAIGLTILLNLYFIVPFLDYYINETVAIQTRMQKDQLIQEDGAYLWQFVAFLQNPFGTIISNHEDIMAFTPGILLMTALFAGIVECVVTLRGRQSRNGMPDAAEPKSVKRVESRENKGMLTFLVAASLLLIWVSSSLFPWNLIERIPVIGKILISVQFPFRYIAILCLVLAMLLGVLLSGFCRYAENLKDHNDRKYQKDKKDWKDREKAGKMKKTAIILTAILALFTPIFFTAEYALNYEPVYYVETADLDSADVGYFEYLRAGTKKSELSGGVYYEGLESVEIVERDGTDMKLYVVGELEDGEYMDNRAGQIAEADKAYIEVPILNYKGYKAWDQYGNRLEITDGDQNVIRLTISKDYTGDVFISFEQPLYWTLAALVSFVTLILVISSIISKKRLKTRTQINA